MYDLVNILANLIPDAEKFVLDNDRNLYTPFFQALEKFCINNNVLIGGVMGIDLLIGRPMDRKSYFWELYTENPYDIAKRLAQELYSVKSPHINPKYIAMRTDLRHREMTIMINTRQLIKIYGLDRYRGLQLIKLMGPATRSSYYLQEPIQCVPEEMQLIEIYRTLYTPAKVKDWGIFLEAEKKIYDLVQDSLSEKATKVVKGRGTAPQINRSVVDQTIIEKVIAGTDNVLIGDYAVAMLDSSRFDIAQSPRVQFISATPIDELATGIETVIGKKLPNLIKYGFKITYIKYPLNLPTDFQITKHTLYINFGKEQTPIVDVYNSSTFEMIPFWKPDGKSIGSSKGVKIGNPWVLLRFRFIDMWILKLISNIDADSSRFLRGKILSLLDSVHDLHDLAVEHLNSDPSRIFQLVDYVGVYINEAVAKKKFIKEVGERFFPYYPAKELAGPGETPTEVGNVNV